MKDRQSEFLRALFNVAIEAALPAKTIQQHIPKPPKGRTIVIGCGKAAATMASSFERSWQHELSGLVVTRYGHKVETSRIEVLEASHPIPNEAGMEATKRILELLTDTTEDDLVVFLVSGGGSALFTLPAPGLTLLDKMEINAALLSSGANITEMNCVRKHLSAVKGGRLARAIHPAKCLTLAISDIPGDELAVIASGPTTPDQTTFSDALAILSKYGITKPKSVLEHLRAGIDETPTHEDPAFENVETKLISTPQMSLEAAADLAKQNGYTPIILGDAIEGEAREVARVMAAITKQVIRHGQPSKAPCILLSGGETTVTVRGKGHGGRNVEFLLALSLELSHYKNVWALSGDTDGIDGTEENAGAIINPSTIPRALELGLDAKAMLADNDGYSFFEALNDLVITGPTLTNVNDFRAILIES